MIRTFDGAVAVMTGAASGIGLAMSKELAARGAKVIATDVRAAECEAAAKEIGSGARAETLDVTRPEDVERVIASVFEREGRLDYLFNNAGIGVLGPIERFSLDDWRRTFAVNIDGVVHGIHAAYPRMIKQGFGHIVNTASIAGLGPAAPVAAYSASKHAVVGLSRSIRLEAAPHGVRVSALCPGVIRTPLLTGGAFGKVLHPTKLEEGRILKWWGRLRPIDPGPFARIAINAVAKNREIIVVPRWLGAVLWIGDVLPPLQRVMMRADFKKTRADFPELFAPLPPNQ